MSDARRKLYEDMQMLIGGHPLDVVVGALCDSLGAAIGFVAADMPQAEQMVNEIPADIMRCMRDNWDYIRSLRAKSHGTGRA